MKKTKYSIYSTDYFFEDLYNKCRTFLATNSLSTLAAIKMLFVMTWFKDIN
ncbi:MAG: hypothetical protein WBA19_06325 [Psychroserpens sp.]